jgi:hypothetical protein
MVRNSASNLTVNFTFTLMIYLLMCLFSVHFAIHIMYQIQSRSLTAHPFSFIIIFQPMSLYSLTTTKVSGAIVSGHLRACMVQ